MITLKLKNTRNFVIASEEDKKRFYQVVVEIIQIVEALTVGATTSTRLDYLYLSLITLVLNEPEVCKEQIASIKRTLERLVQEQLIDEDNYLLASVKDLKKFRREFLD